MACLLKGFSFSCNKNSTGRPSRAGTETPQCHETPTFPLNHPLYVFMLVASWPKMAAPLCHHICSPGRKKGKGKGQKHLLAEYVSFNKKTVAFLWYLIRWLSLMSLARMRSCGYSFHLQGNLGNVGFFWGGRVSGKLSSQVELRSYVQALSSVSTVHICGLTIPIYHGN